MAAPATTRHGRSSPSVQYLLLAWVLLPVLFLAQAAAFCSLADAQEKTPEVVAAGSASNAEKLMAELSDEQVRQLLIKELQKDSELSSPASPSIKGPASILSVMLKALSDAHDKGSDNFAILWSAVPNVIPDLYNVYIKLCPYGTSRGAMLNLLWVAFFIGVGFGVELLIRRFFMARYFRSEPDGNNTDLGPLTKLLSSLTQLLPSILGLIFFFGAAYFSFMVFIWTDSPYVQLFFLAVLIAITCIRAIAIFSSLIFSPDLRYLRILPMQCSAAMASSRFIIWTTAYIVSALMFAVVTRRLGASKETVLLIQLFFATGLLAGTALAVIFLRQRVAAVIVAAEPLVDQGSDKRRRQFAAIWHILALTYLFILWLLLFNDLANPDIKNSGAFILSFFVVPIWMIADRLMQWIVSYSMKTLKIHQDSYDDRTTPSEEDLEQRRRGKELYHRVRTVARIGVVGALFIWVASLWSIHIPFFSQLAAVLLDTILILTVAMFFWQFISSWIERKISESTPVEEDTDTNDEDWGSAAKRGRAYTLLPMIRKFIGTVLTVMVTMMVLSSLGVDIGPLLAGAGVIGLAIGFGAQKLVADIFSGFFYLLDDAFRVGEYVTAGSVSGTVENITLRNIMLRHHRGMLQIIPHSELGAITNFMRGGLIVKFNLDFPYDAPIEKIRKVIKKVGQKMLENEEYGKDIIRPIKSQGIREITNSVMTIRIKFTAQPGSHFIIRREAYRLITEALNAQGIFYAHRKVIVDLPDAPGSKNGQDSPDLDQRLSRAAGAAAMRSMEDADKAAGAAKAADGDDLLSD